MQEKSNLLKLREEINEVTMDIFKLCKKRVDLAMEIAHIKIQEDLPVLNSEVEKELKNRIQNFCKENRIEENFCLQLFKLLLKESKRIQEKIFESKT